MPAEKKGPAIVKFWPTLAQRLVQTRCWVIAVALLFWLLSTDALAFVVINEIMYNPAKGEKKDLEFVELLNDSPTTCEVGGWKFSSAMEFIFPPGTSIPAYGYLVICSNPDAFRQTYKIKNVIGPFSGKLDNAGAVVELRNESGGLIDRVDYKDDAPWPAGADGTGHSISLIDSLSKNERGQSWALSNEMGGTPGHANFPNGPRRPTVLINEVLGDSSKETWIELCNPTTSTIDLSDFLLSDEADTLAKFVIPKGTAITPGGFAVFRQKQMGFALSPKRRKVFLTAPQARFVLDAVAYRQTTPDNSCGRWPDGLDTWYRMTQPTPDAANTVTLTTDIVINEIMYHPFSERREDEYVELYNRSRSPVDLSGWAFTKGIEIVFPQGTILAPDGYLVVAEDSQALKAKYGITNCIGDYKKQLSHKGDHLVLCDALGNVADEVAYAEGGRWPAEADGRGSSLELIDPRQDNAYPSAWAASDETGKAQWTHIEYSKPHGTGISEFQFFLLDEGALLIDDLELRYENKNHIRNGTFDQDTKGWSFDGTHKYSGRYTADSHSGGACLQVAAVGGGDPVANNINTNTSGTLATSRTYTVSYWARWQSGNNRLCTRTHANGVAQTNAVPVPDKLGTPGRRNSRYQENIGPIITDVRHQPVTPTSTTAVTVSARILDADGVASATVHFRLDGGRRGKIIPMFDDGRHGDGALGDGLYGAILPSQSTDTIVEFYVQAADRRGATQNFPTKGPRGPALYYVRGQAPRPTRLKSFDLLMTSATLDRLYKRSQTEERMDNEMLDATLVMNDSRAFYNIGVRYAGSYWTRPTRGSLFFAGTSTRRPSFRVELNADEDLLGFKVVNFDSQFVDPFCLHERMYYWLVARLGGIPWNAREYVMLSQNGRRFGVVEMIQLINRRFIEDYFPGNDNGELYEINDAFEWAKARPAATHAQIRYAGPDKEKYRFNFEKRSHQKEDDFSSLIELLRVLDRNVTDDAHYEAAVEATLDVDQWLRYFACIAAASDWDSIGFTTGKNVYLYRRPDTGRWILIPWDKDLSFQNPKMAVFNPSATNVYRFLTWPPYRRIYLSYIEQLIQGPLTHKEFDPVADSIHAMIVGEGDKIAATEGIELFVTLRRQWLLDNILPKATSFTITTSGGKDFETSASAVRLEGTAPLSVRTIEMNGQPTKLRWTPTGTWNIENVALQAGTNRIVLVARPMPSANETSRTITITRR